MNSPQNSAEAAVLPERCRTTSHGMYCRGLNSYQYHASEFLIWLQYQLPRRDLKMIFVIMQAPTVQSCALTEASNSVELA